ncbi:MAG: CesT family type III secretion system chaperone [Succinivibrio sp.]|nr:CesT family type III secretion system chaperone [Succinivibrio sp.]
MAGENVDLNRLDYELGQLSEMLQLPQKLNLEQGRSLNLKIGDKYTATLELNRSGTMLLVSVSFEAALSTEQLKKALSKGDWSFGAGRVLTSFAEPTVILTMQLSASAVSASRLQQCLMELMETADSITQS